MANINKIRLSGQTYDIQDSNASKTVELTQAEYDNLPSSAKTSNTFFVITDATAADISQYWTSAQTQSAINQATSGKADTSAVAEDIAAAVSGKVDTSAITSSVTSASTDSEIPTAKAVFDAIPTGGTGGGKAISAGTNISVTTGETADTVNCTIPFEDSSNNLLLGYNLTLGGGTYYSLGISPKGSSTSIQTKISGNNAIAIGNNVTITGGTSNRGEYSVAIGKNSNVYGTQSTALGVGCNASGNNTLAIGRYSTSKGNDSVAIGNQANVSGNSSVAIGRLANVSGDSSVAIGSGATANGVDYKTNINNQLKINTSNQVYISNSANTSTYCVQEKIEATEAALGGLSLVKLTQAEYDALVTKDSNTLYVIVN